MTDLTNRPLPPYYLEFQGADRCGWNGPWPPPERLWVARGMRSGMVERFEPDQQDPAVLAELELSPAVDLERYRRASFSTMSPDSSNVMPGALYVRDGGTDD